MRYWSVLFALAALFSVGAFVYAPFSPDWWLPNPTGEHHHVVSTFGREIDSLFVIILWITGHRRSSAPRSPWSGSPGGSSTRRTPGPAGAPASTSTAASGWR